MPCRANPHPSAAFAGSGSRESWSVLSGPFGSGRSFGKNAGDAKYQTAFARAGSGSGHSAGAVLLTPTYRPSPPNGTGPRASANSAPAGGNNTSA